MALDASSPEVHLAEDRKQRSPSPQKSSIRPTNNDVMKQIEEFVKPKRKKKGDESYLVEEDVYDMCD